ncbi:DNA polymerase III subunit epsilon [Snodgrassella alvi]|uniref:DNA polymerase III subunit epsilon n=1 Tax=Snodgrassella alvi TaxID=1196083 RepID=UPI000C1E1C5A|nr:DNA polymerase III subunit epsilon [Snodgrassella alvi]PIT09180.1 DNA polymerase III subunit epsilon [Snodgrassella alvi]PIT56675.1 DNA polymerase III subunit epsilon [Snodgrassella alvi]
MNMRQIILDTETTGLSANNGDRLIEFAGVEMIDRRLTGNNLHLYINPERDIPEEAVAVHGITLEKLNEMNAPVFADVAQQIADYIRGAELIIHNASFDEGFLDMEFERLGMPRTKTITSDITDTLKMARDRYPGQKNSLDALCTRLEVDRSKRVLHGALIDCELLGEVYLAMTRSQFSLVDELMATTTASNNPAAGGQYQIKHAALPVVTPSSEELAEHENYLQALDKIAGAPCVWRQWQQDTEDKSK